MVQPDPDSRHRVLPLKILLPVGTTFALFVVSIFLVILPGLEESLMEQKRHAIRELVQIVHARLQQYDDQVRRGLLTEAEARAAAAEELRSWRYGSDGKDYFWLLDMGCRMIMHPYRSDLEGRDVSGFEDSQGKRLFVEFVRVSASPSGGYVDYTWQWKDDASRIVPKVSYVKQFEPWGWIVGTGIYVEDVRRDMAAARSKLVLVALVILLLVAALSVYVVWEGRTIQRQRNRAELLVENIIDSMPSALIGVDAMGRITLWNSGAQAQTGISSSEALGRELIDLLPRFAPDVRRGKDAIRNRELLSARRQSRREGDSVLYEDITFYPLRSASEDGKQGAVLRIDDVTTQVRMEETLIQNEKMLSVGGLAAGMAHEINNPLAGILQTAQVLSNRLGERRDLPANRRAAEAAGTTMEVIQSYLDARGAPRMLKTIREEAMRVANIVDNMLSFSRKSTSGRCPCDLRELVESTVQLAQTDYNLKKSYDFRNVEVTNEVAVTLPPVSCEGSKIQQVILNIIRNAAQAMHAAKTPSPRIEIRASLDDQRGVVIEIEDNGPGMSEETQKRAFEPFFTTKEVGAGTGLGLSVSYFIVTHDHGGELSVDSEPGGGCRFQIRLPVERAEP